MRKGMIRFDTDDAAQRAERKRVGREMEGMGLAGRVSEGPETPLTDSKMAPRTLGEKATVKKQRLLGGNPKKGGGYVGKTTKGRVF